jgi:hypothetical protein
MLVYRSVVYLVTKCRRTTVSVECVLLLCKDSVAFTLNDFIMDEFKGKRCAFKQTRTTNHIFSIIRHLSSIETVYIYQSKELFLGCVWVDE